MNKKGFTLVELMVVIVIIGILAAVAAPKLSDNINSARCNEVPKKFKEITDKLVAEEAATGVYASYDKATIVSDLGVSKNSTFWEYSVTAAVDGATCEITATALKPIGDIKATETIVIAIPDGTKTDNTTDDVATKKYMKAWFAN